MTLTIVRTKDGDLIATFLSTSREQAARRERTGRAVNAELEFETVVIGRWDDDLVEYLRTCTESPYDE